MTSALSKYRLLPVEVPMTRNFDCRVIQHFDLCKLDYL